MVLGSGESCEILRQLFVAWRFLTMVNFNDSGKEAYVNTLVPGSKSKCNRIYVNTMPLKLVILDLKRCFVAHSTR